MKNSLTIPVAIVVGGIIVAMAVYASVPKSAPQAAGNPALVRPVGVEDHILGNPAAKVMIVEYTDFDCAFCRGYHDTLRQIIATEGSDGSVAWVLRHYPQTEAGSNALSAARAAECADITGGNEAFWRFADALYASQRIEPSEYGTLAARAGITSSAFATCYANVPESVTARILGDRQNALDMGISMVPYSLILVAGKPPVVMEGPYPYDAVKELVEKALGQ